MASRNRTKLVLFLVLLFISSVSFTLLALAQEPILEHYVLKHGGDSEGNSSDITLYFQDDHVDGGTAKARIEFSTKGSQGLLRLMVWRKVSLGEIVFALLVFRVEIRCYNFMGDLVYSRDLKPFSFGDSSSGRWSAFLKDLPININRLEVIYVGNYE